MFHQRTEAVQVLAEAGFDHARLPTWQARSPSEFWHEVNDLLGMGILADGRRRVLAVAAGCYPANDLLRAAASAAEAEESADPGGPTGPTAPPPAGPLSAADIGRFVDDAFPPYQRWGDRDALIEVVTRLLRPDETPLDIANGTFGRSTPGSGIIALTSGGITIADRETNGTLSQLLRIAWPQVHEARLAHRRRGILVAVADLELVTDHGRIIFRGLLRDPAIRITERIRTTISAQAAPG